MLKRINWGLIFKSFCWVLSLAGLVVLMSFVSIKKQAQAVTDVKILIPGADNFIEREEITSILQHNFGELRGKSLQDINIHEIEQKISINPYIAAVNVYAEMDGVIKIKVKQRQPILRIINAGNQDFYLDNEGNKMPVSSNFTANVLVATGNIGEGFNGSVERFSSSLLADLFKTAMFIRQDTLWDAQIEQIYVDERNEMELIPRVGIQRILLGNATDLEIKMNNLLIFYKKAMPKVGWDTYKTINIKYTNQIVCEKNKIDSNAVLKAPVLVNDSLAKEVTDQQLVEEKVNDVVNTILEKEATKVQNMAPGVNKTPGMGVKLPPTKQVPAPAATQKKTTQELKEKKTSVSKPTDAGKNKTQ